MVHPNFYDFKEKILSVSIKTDIYIYTQMSN